MVRKRIPTVLSYLKTLGILILFVLAACSPQAEEEIDQDAAQDGVLYRLFIDGPSEGEVQVRRFYGELRLADFEAIFAEATEQDNEGNFFGGPIVHEGVIWNMAANPSTNGVNLISISPDGTLSSSTDLNGDRVVDIADIVLPDGRHITFMTERLGMEVFEGLLEGHNLMCEVGFIETLGLDVFGCPNSSAGSGGSSMSGGLGIYDPWDEMCSQYGSTGSGGAIGGRYTRGDLIVVHTPTSRPRTGGGHIEEDTSIIRDDLGHVMTHKTIRYYDAEGNLERTSDEYIDSLGDGYRIITDKKEDGSEEVSQGRIQIWPVPAGGDYDPSQTHPPLTDPRSEGGSEGPESPPESPPDPNQGNPGPDGDDTAIREMCAARANWRSGVEQANEQDPSSFSVSCGDLVDAPSSETCIIIEWARPEDFAGAVQPSDDDGCGEFQDPAAGGMCEPTSAMERIRGLTAMFAHIEFEEFIVCPQVLCDPNFTEVQNPEPISGGAPAEPLMSTYTLCWRGPGSQYDVVSSLAVDLAVDVIGVGDQEGWLVIDNPRYPGVACWVEVEDVSLPPGFDLDELPVYFAPPVVDQASDDDNSSAGNGGGPSPGAPDAPSSLNAVEVFCDTSNGYRIKLTWKDNSDNESGFRIYRNGQLIATVGPNVTQFTTGSINESGQQSFYVEAYNPSGSAQSNTAVEDGCMY